jgi:hypothetical protein
VPTDTPTPRLIADREVAAAAPPLLVRRVEAARLAGVSVATWDRLDAAGRTPAAVRLGGAKLYRVEDLREWVSWGCPERGEFEARRAAQRNGRLM